MKSFDKNIYLALSALLVLMQYASAQTFTIKQNFSYGGSRSEGATSIIQAGNNNYVTAGETQSPDGQVTGFHHDPDFWIIKTNSAGKLIWQKDIGGSKDDVPFDIVKSNDGGFVAVGETGSADGDISFNHGGLDFFVVKLNSAGNVVWKKTYGGISDEDAQSIVATPDGGFLVAGGTRSRTGDVTNNHGATDMWVIRLSSSGVLQWQKTYGNIFSEEAYEIALTADGGFVLAGRTQGIDGDQNKYNGAYDFAVVKVDKRGNVQWQKAYGGTLFDEAHSIYQTADGGYVVGGFSGSTDGQVTGNHGFNDIWVIRIDSNGNLLWQKSLGGSADDRTFDVIPATGGGIIVSGDVSSTDGDIHGNHGTGGYDDMWIANLDDDGNVITSSCFGGFYTEEAHSVIPAYNGGYILAGSANSFAGDGDVSRFLGGGDYWIVKAAMSATAEIMDMPLANNNELRIAPNPNNGNFKIILPQHIPSIKTIIITNPSGNEVFRIAGTYKTEYAISLSNKSVNGVYTVAVVCDDKIFKQQVLIQQ